MGASSLGPFLERLLVLFLDGYDKQSLRALLLFKMNQTLAHEVSEGENFRTVVFNLLVKSLLEGWLLELAEKARDARQRLKPEWVPAVVELQVALSRVVTPPASGLVAVPRGKAPPDDLRAVIQRYDRVALVTQRDDPTPPEVPSLADRMSTFPLEDYALTDYFLLSDSPGNRLAAILALSRRPEGRYLPWLAERAAVETPFVVVRAAEAIREAAVALPLIDLDGVTRAAGAAVRWLAATIPTTHLPDRLRASLEIATRTLNLLSEAVDRVNRRTTGRL